MSDEKDNAIFPEILPDEKGKLLGHNWLKVPKKKRIGNESLATPNSTKTAGYDRFIFEEYIGKGGLMKEGLNLQSSPSKIRQKGKIALFKIGENSSPQKTEQTAPGQQQQVQQQKVSPPQGQQQAGPMPRAQQSPQQPQGAQPQQPQRTQQPQQPQVQSPQQPQRTQQLQQPQAQSPQQPQRTQQPPQQPQAQSPQQPQRTQQPQQPQAQSPQQPQGAQPQQPQRTQQPSQQPQAQSPQQPQRTQQPPQQPQGQTPQQPQRTQQPSQQPQGQASGIQQPQKMTPGDQGVQGSIDLSNVDVQKFLSFLRYVINILSSTFWGSPRSDTPFRGSPRSDTSFGESPRGDTTPSMITYNDLLRKPRTNISQIPDIPLLDQFIREPIAAFETQQVFKRVHSILGYTPPVLADTLRRMYTLYEAEDNVATPYQAGRLRGQVTRLQTIMENHKKLYEDAMELLDRHPEVLGGVAVNAMRDAADNTDRQIALAAGIAAVRFLRTRRNFEVNKMPFNEEKQKSTLREAVKNAFYGYVGGSDPSLIVKVEELARKLIQAETNSQTQ
jgi:hypothetical protein